MAAKSVSKGIDKLLIKIVTAELLGLTCSYVTKTFGDYELLSKPPLSPPMHVFPIIWTILFFLAGIASYIVSITEKTKSLEQVDEAMFFYKAVLFISLLWTIFFFAAKLLLFSSICMILLLYAVAVTITKFRRINGKAGVLLIPFLLWSIFAAYINIGIWLLTVLKVL